MSTVKPCYDPSQKRSIFHVCFLLSFQKKIILHIRNKLAMQPTNLQDYYAQLLSWKKQGLTLDEISLRFQQTGVPENLIQEAVQKWKVFLEKKRNTAFIFCGIGIALLSLGCFVTLLFFNTGTSFDFALYGLTIIGVVCVFKGMYDLMS
jgi:hypothetical protein